MHWCKHGTMVTGSSKFREICIVGPRCRCMKKVGILHQINDYIFEFSIPVASFRYKEWIGANTVPWLVEAPNFGKSALSAIYVAA